MLSAEVHNLKRTYRVKRKLPGPGESSSRISGPAVAGAPGNGSGNGSSNGTSGGRAASRGNGRGNGSGGNSGNGGGNGNGAGRTTSRRSRSDHDKTASRWPWVLICLVGVLFIVAIGISSTKPEGNSFIITVAAMLARSVSAVAGVFAMFLCFMLMLNSVVKIANPGDPLPRFVWGLWVILLFASAAYHAVKVPWENVFESAKTGGGGGLMGASISWFLHIAVTKPLSFVAMFLGLTVGVSLVLGKSAWAPFAFIWMLAMTGWQWVRDFLADFFKEHGPNPEDLEAEPEGVEDEGEVGLEDLLTDPPRRKRASFGEADREAAPSSMTATVTELKERLAKRDADAAQPVESLPGVGTLILPAAPESGAPATPKGRKPASADTGSGADQVEEFMPAMEQMPLTEDLFYEFPSVDILQKSEAVKRLPRGKEDIDGISRVIEKTLLSFGVVAKVVNVEQGPTVARFELQPGPGVKVASVVSLNQDLALALAAQDVRIEAPIPGKAAIGIEVPNKEVSMVHLRDVLEMREFRNSKSPLTIALGKDVSGRAVVTTLDHCLHFLIAGATGMGKSVCINSIIASLLYKARPDEVKLVLIDPKRVEFTVWARVPHLIAPVVTDPKKAAGALRWAIKEMEARYEKFTKVGTRDIDRYNQVATPPGSIKPAMPYIVIVIDELSDLMMVAPADVEDAIFRLAQMARASGIYLIVATQRPSVDVITGTIKANIPTRVAFAVASQVDSRTILDIAGAEKLLGRGDMLFSPVGSTKPLRAQGCYVSEREIDELVSFVSAQAKPQFAPGILAEPEAAAKDTEVQDDPFFPQALRIVVEAKQASVSLLQRKLPIGYSRAARLIDAMEVKGYVGTYEGSKPREVRLTIQEYMRLFEGGGIMSHGADANIPGAGATGAAGTPGSAGGPAALGGPAVNAGPSGAAGSSPADGTHAGGAGGTGGAVSASRPNVAGSSSGAQDKAALTKPSFLANWTPQGRPEPAPKEKDEDRPTRRNFYDRFDRRDR